MTNYVKFRRGTPAAFNQLLQSGRVEQDTLYFIYDESGTLSAELYLGNKKISGTGESTTNSLSGLIDVNFSSEINDKSLLVYDAVKGHWINETINDVLKDYALDLEEQSVIISVVNDLNNTHESLIDQEFINIDPKAGDIVIIKDPIADNKYQYTAYVFDNLQWQAMSGNYNANNIYFNDDFIFTENIGTIEIPENVGNIVVDAKGKNLKEFLNTIFAEEKSSNVIQPSATIELGSSVTSYEVGSYYTPSYTVIFNSGSYSYGPAITNVIPSYTVSDTQGNISNLAANTFEAFMIEDDNEYKITAKIDFTQGDIPFTNLGNPDESSRIQAGSLTQIISRPINGYRKSFYGILNHKDSYSIRDLNSSNMELKNDSSFVINLQEDTKKVVIAYPATLRDLTAVLDFNDSSSNIVESFGEPEIIPVEGANGYKAIDYKVYTLPFANPYGTQNKFIVTI